MQKIHPSLWFDNQAQQAAEFYVSVFPNSEILETSHYLEGMPGEPGSVLTVRFVLDGHEFDALNGGPVYQFTPAISFVVDCETQDEIDHYWSSLTSDGGLEVQCGWLTDKFGVSWQIVPSLLGKLLSSPDKAAAKRAADAMLKMIKLDISELQTAFDGE